MPNISLKNKKTHTKYKYINQGQTIFTAELGQGHGQDHELNLQEVDYPAKTNLSKTVLLIAMNDVLDLDKEKQRKCTLEIPNKNT